MNNIQSYSNSNYSLNFQANKTNTAKKITRKTYANVVNKKRKNPTSQETLLNSIHEMVKKMRLTEGYSTDKLLEESTIKKLDNFLI